MENSSTISEQSQASRSRNLGFEFRGDGMEYFKIWIVNVLLTIVTLGIYSAWAKVRSNRYFYSNMYLDNSNFRYLADPITILKGRIIAVAAFIAYSVIASRYQMLGMVLLVILILAIPYFVNQSMAFNNRMSAYKNIQFRFSASYREALMVLYVWPILGLLSLGILYPLAMLRLHQYRVRNSAYGTTKFEFGATYGNYGVVFLTILGIGIIVGLPVWAINTYVPVIAFISPIAIALIYLGLILFFMVRIANLFYCNLSLAGNQFVSNVTMAGLGKVILINFFLTVITLGLYLPAAKVRATKYYCSCISLNEINSLDNFAAAEKENITALGEEFGQVFDFGL